MQPMRRIVPLRLAGSLAPLPGALLVTLAVTIPARRALAVRG